MELSKELKVVDYKGIPCIIPIDHTRMAVDKSGELYSYQSEPFTVCETWSANQGECKRIAEVDLEDMNWEESLIEVAA